MNNSDRNKKFTKHLILNNTSKGKFILQVKKVKTEKGQELYFQYASGTVITAITAM